MSSEISNFKKEAITINKYFQELVYSEFNNGNPCISGELILRDEQGFYVDSYFIRIEPSGSYPLRFPFVFETEGRIPCNIDWHVFPDGHCCIKSIPDEALLCKQGITLLGFIEQQVKPYFFNQKFREIHGYLLHERPHGLDGNIEFFEDIFKTKDLKLIAKGLFFIQERKEPDRVSKCFCGSGLKYRKCHRNTYNILSVFNDEELDFYLRIVISSNRFIITK